MKDFKELYEEISPRLRFKAYSMAQRYLKHNVFIDEGDLYQEMCMHLWNNFKDGVTDIVNNAYIIKGCEFHVLNYLRTKRSKAIVLSIDDPINDKGNTLKDILGDKRNKFLKEDLDSKITVNQIMNNGFTPKEKQVFSLLLKGNTTREVGSKLGISHVMVIKYKQSIAKKWHNKEDKDVTKR